MAEKKEKTLLLALFDCFQSFASGIAYFEESSDGKEYVEKLWASKAENWYIVYCGDICVLSLGTRSDKVPVAFVQNTMAGKITTANQAILRVKMWPTLSGKPFETLVRKQEQHLKNLIEKGVQLHNSKDNESKKRKDCRNEFAPHKDISKRVWDADALISLEHLEIQLNQQYDYVLQLFLNEPYEILCKRREFSFLYEIIQNKEEEYSHNQILALYTGALLLGLNISDEEKVRKLINRNVEEYLNRYFKTKEPSCPQVRTSEVSTREKMSFRLKRFSPQINLFFAEKKKSQNAIYIEEMIDKLVEADEDEDTGYIYDRIKGRIDVVVEGLMKSALIENLNYRELDKFMSGVQEEIAQLIPHAESKVNAHKNDPICDLKLDMIAALRIYIIIRFLQLGMSYGSLLLSQASDQIEKESSKIREDIMLKKELIDKKWAELTDNENEIESIMINKYGGNTV